jgi:C-terminal processing protease CtpA/Prc
MMTLNFSTMRLAAVCVAVWCAPVCAIDAADGTTDQERADLFDSWLKQLGAETFAEREAAMKQLLSAADQDPDTVLLRSLRVHDETTDPEVKYRSWEIVKSTVGGQLVTRPRGFLGVQLSKLTEPQLPGVPLYGPIVVQRVVEGSAADNAGLQVGDVILGLDQQVVTPDVSLDDFIFSIQMRKPGTKVEFVVWRLGSARLAYPVLGQIGDEDAARRFSDADFFDRWLKVARSRLNPIRNP